MQETIAYLEQHGFRWPRAWAIGEMAHAHAVEGDPVKSIETWQQCLAELQELGDIYGVLDSLTMIADLVIDFGQAGATASILGAIRKARTSVGNRRTWSFASESLVVANAKAALGDSEFEVEQDRTESTQLADVIAMALNVRPSSASSTANDKSPGLSFGLTARELEILQLLSQGKSNQEIGDELFISPRTAGTHVANILGKLGVHTRSAAVAVALNEGLA